jgi:hypothetical protein
LASDPAACNGHDRAGRTDTESSLLGTGDTILLELFEQKGMNVLIHLVGFYSLVSTTLNGFDVPVPEHE